MDISTETVANPEINKYPKVGPDAPKDDVSWLHAAPVATVSWTRSDLVIVMMHNWIFIYGNDDVKDIVTN